MSQLLCPEQSHVSPSVGKRLRSSDDDSATAKLPRLDANKVFDLLTAHDSHLDSAKTALASANAAFNPVFATDGANGTILAGLLKAISELISHSEAMKSTLVDFCKVSSSPVAPATPGPYGHQVSRSLSNPAAGFPPRKPPPTPADTAANKVKRVLREAERRVVVFDLNLGAAPTINKETISRKVTMALHDKVKEGKHDWNISDAGEMVDDVLSCSQLEFLGSSTRKFYNGRDKNDPRNGTMCTVPVRMDFKNKDTRIRAESTLRGICKANCSVPYPRKLRALIYDTVQLGKKDFPKCYIKTKVDIDNLTLSAQARVENEWKPVGKAVPIPLDILDKFTVIPPEDNNIEMGGDNPTPPATEDGPFS